MKKFFTLFLALATSVGTLFLQSCTPSWNITDDVTASGTCGANLTWTLRDTVLTVSGTGAMDDWAFSVDVPWYSYQKKITTVTIGNSVTSIGNGAFNDCIALRSVTIPNSVTSIGGGAFNNCPSLMSVTIPDNVTGIGDYAFNDCFGLTSLTIGNSVTTIGYSAFAHCTALTSLTLPNSVTSIGELAFYGCSGLTSVTIPDNVTSLGDAAFIDCYSLNSVTIGRSISLIGEETFSGCTGLKSITCYAAVPPVCGDDAFASVNRSIPVYVPDPSIDAYKAADVWKEFTILGHSDAP